MLGHAYYAADLFCAVAFPLLVWLGRSRAWPNPHAWRLFWVGAAIGLSWEIPIFAMSAWTGTPILVWQTPLPLPPAAFIVAHSSWDGALLLAGYEIARRITTRRGASPFGVLGISIQVLWGQLTEICVELSAIGAGTWVYLDGLWFNPPWAFVAGHPLPTGLQVAWLCASLAFAGVAARVTRS
jgi:hypothetical protein